MNLRRPVRSEVTRRAETRQVTYLAIEGPPGSGVTELALRLARSLNARLVLDQARENPFLEEFLASPRRAALKAQLFFTLSRYLQQQQIGQHDLFHRMVISDYLFARDRLYASLTLDDRELALYEKLIGVIGAAVPRPDLVVYLPVDPARLEQGFHQPGHGPHPGLGGEYLVALGEAYNYYFFHYEEAPLLIVPAEPGEPARDETLCAALLAELERPQAGVRFLERS